jgi:hypothetical protein
MALSQAHWDGVPTVMIENDHLRVVVAPSIGGRVVSLVHRPREREWLWRNPHLTLAPCAPGTAYDPNFYGGLDEVIPGDLPETIHGIAVPDHGELWTLPLQAEAHAGALILRGRLPQFGLEYRRVMRLDANRLRCGYEIVNRSGAARTFLWKMHAALAVHPGDRVVCPAATAQPVEPAWSRRPSPVPFAWPNADGRDYSVVPAPDGTTEFLYLTGLLEGRLGLAAADGARLDCSFDPAVFPCCVFFAAYGAMGGAYTAVLEPCSAMPASVTTAAERGFCSRLAAGASLVTELVWTVD